MMIVQAANIKDKCVFLGVKDVHSRVFVSMFPNSSELE